MMQETLGQYRIAERLGEGGMGEVYRAVDEMLDRDVALKMLRPELAHRQEVVDRFRAEAMTLAKLDHPNIARLYGLSKHDDHLFMVMEYVPGMTLSSRVETQGRLPWREAARIMSQVLLGLESAHAYGVVHRDIKPANIIVTPQGRVKVTDFGIARVLGTSRATRVGSIVGTLEYMAPEQIRGEEVDGRADLYAAGVVLYELLTGNAPFSATTEYELMQLHLHAPVPSIRPLAGDVPPWFDGLIARALAKAPADRFDSAASFRAELDRLVAAEPMPIAKETRLGMTVPVASMPAPTLVGSEAPTRLGTEAPVLPGTAAPPTRLGTEPPATRLAGAAPAATRLATTPAPVVANAPALIGNVTWRHLAGAAAIVLLIGAAMTGIYKWRTPEPVAPVPTPTPGGAAMYTPPPTTIEPPVTVVPPPTNLPTHPTVPSSPATPPGARTTPPPVPLPPPAGGVVTTPTPTSPPSTPAPTTPPPTNGADVGPGVSTPALVLRPSMTFKDASLVVIDGKKTDVVDATLHFDVSQLVVMDKDSKETRRSLSYAKITAASYVESKGPPAPGVKATGVKGVASAVTHIFRRSDRWLTLDGGGTELVLRLDDDNYEQVLSEISLRSGVKVTGVK